MKVTWLHRDKCPGCSQIIWTQTDDKVKKKTRPSLHVQCWCGQTIIKDSTTISGGGDSFSEEEFDEIIWRNNFGDELKEEGVKLTIKPWQHQV